MVHSCLILGDSIAVGLASVIKGCAVIAKVGMSSAWILAHAYSGNFDTVYISAGSNDPYNPALVENLKGIKNRFPFSRRVWIAPVNGRAKSAVYSVSFGDKVVNFTPGRDHVHPASYASLGNAAR